MTEILIIGLVAILVYPAAYLYAAIRARYNRRRRERLKW